MTANEAGSRPGKEVTSAPSPSKTPNLGGMGVTACLQAVQFSAVLDGIASDAAAAQDFFNGLLEEKISRPALKGAVANNKL